MATTDETALKMLGAAAVGAAAGVVIGAAIASGDRRATFARLVSDRLAGSGVRLLGSDLGRDASRPVWILSVGLPQGTYLTLNVPVVGDAYAPATARALAEAVVTYLRRRQLLVA